MKRVVVALARTIGDLIAGKIYLERALEGVGEISMVPYAWVWRGVVGDPPAHAGGYIMRVATVPGGKISLASSHPREGVVMMIFRA